MILFIQFVSSDAEWLEIIVVEEIILIRFTTESSIAIRLINKRQAKAHKKNTNNFFAWDRIPNKL